ncbi:MAG: hypothetical protein R6W96_04840 [Clostridia bacterium]
MGKLADSSAWDPQKGFVKQNHRKTSKIVVAVAICLVSVALLGLTGCAGRTQKGNEQNSKLDLGSLLTEPSVQEELFTHHTLPYVSFSRSHSLYIDEHGNLWGRGALGNINEDENVPYGYYEEWVKIMENAVQAKANNLMSVVLKQDGSLWMFGYHAPYEKPTEIGERIKEIIDSNDRSCIVLSDDGDALVYNVVNVVDTKTLEYLGKAIEKKVLFSDVHTIATGRMVRFYLQNNGALWGEGQIYGSIFETEPVKIMEHVSWVHSNGWFTFVVTEDHQLYGWGNNVFGQLGVPAGDAVLFPIKIMDGVNKAYASSHTSYVIMEDNSLWTFGRYVSPHLRNDEDTTKMHQPVKMLDHVLEAYVFQTDSTFLAAYALQKDGTLYGWGKNGSYTGNGSSDLSINVISHGVQDVLKDNISGGRPSFLRNDQTIWTWGVCPSYIRVDITGFRYELKPMEYIYDPVLFIFP